ncbi:MAG: succinylglutamate desuccinylase/aspartoacylase family protein [Saprospiraceae bacterium]|nr:succinylglutamate desuccinylase/aspartoacylase family protein [Saprospiraceae bacterium]
MTSNLFEPKLNNIKELIIDNEIITPGKLHTIRMNAGKLPSDNRINVFAHVMHTGIHGPSLLILGGLHGNEINGIEIIRRSLEDGLYNSVTSGTVIIVPLLNVFGFINFSRDVTDGKDVNRSFPGHLNGSLASRVARIITKKILPFVDIAIDFHTGGDARYNYPQIRFNKNDKVAKQLAFECGVKFIIEQPLIAHSFRKAAFDMKVPAIVYEGGESIRLDKMAITNGIIAVKNILISLQMIEDKPQHISSDKWIIHKQNWVRASTPGIFIWKKKSGDFVRKGEKLGEIKDPYGTKSADIFSTYSGHIIGHNNASVVSLGDALFHIGYDYSPAE